MVYIVLKFILAIILTLIPILYTAMIKPKQDKEYKWHSLATFIETVFPHAKKAFKKAANGVVSFRKKMSKYKSARKLFTMIVILLLLGYQFVDTQAMSYAGQTCRNAIESHTEQYLQVGGSDVCKNISGLFLQNSRRNFLYSYLTPAWVYIATLVLTLLLFSDNLSEKIFTRIKGDDNLYVLLGIVATVILFCDEGRYFLLSETLYIFMLAAAFFPKRIYTEPGGGIKVKRRKTFQFT